jgi:hypothetical protein
LRASFCPIIGFTLSAAKPDPTLHLKAANMDSSTAVSPAVSPIVVRAAGLLDDPVMLHWAIRYYLVESRTQEQRQQLIALWFTPGQMRRFFDANEPVTLLLLLENLPPETFLPWADKLATDWAAMPVDLCAACGNVLGRAAPALAADAFAQYLRTVPHIEAQRVANIANNLQHLPADARLALLNQLLALPKPEAHSRAAQAWQVCESDIHFALFKSALDLQHAALPDLFVRLMNAPQAHEATLIWISTRLFGHAAWADLYLVYLQDYRNVSFQEIAALLAADAPIEEMDQAMYCAPGRIAASAALSLLERHHARTSMATLAWHLLKHSDIQRNGVHSTALALSAIACAFALEAIPTADASLAQLLALLALDIKTNPHYAALMRQIGGFGRQDIIAAVAAQMELSPDGYGRIALSKMMGELGWPEFVPMLITCLAGDEEEYLCDVATEALFLAKGAARVLVEKWDAFDYTQQLYAGVVLANNADPEAGAAILDFLLARFDALLEDEFDLWYSLNLMTPDLRLHERIALALERGDDEIGHCFYCVSRLLDVEHPQLATIQQHIVRQEEEKRQHGLERLLHPPKNRLPSHAPSSAVLSAAPHEPIIKEEPKIGRNDPCPCGSGKKHKKCCMP